MYHRYVIILWLTGLLFSAFSYAGQTVVLVQLYKYGVGKTEVIGFLKVHPHQYYLTNQNVMSIRLPFPPKHRYRFKPSG